MGLLLSERSTPRVEKPNTYSLRLDLLHIDGDRAGDRHAEVGGAAGEVRGIGARHQRLGRRAAGVDARAAEAMALDDSNALTCSRQPVRQRGAGLAGANNDGVELGHGASSARSQDGHVAGKGV